MVGNHLMQKETKNSSPYPQVVYRIHKVLNHMHPIANLHINHTEITGICRGPSLRR